jgi:hypothetical protein
MTEPDDVLDILRRARPDDLADELASPQSRTAQALLEEILSVQTTTTPGARNDVPVVRRPVGGSRRRRALVGAAAAAVAAIVVGTVLTAGSGEPTAAATIDAAVARTSDLMSRSGRAEQHYRFETGGTPAVQEWTQRYEFSGNDFSVREDGSRLIDRVVDGKAYIYGPVDPHASTVDENTPFEWRHIPGNYDPETYGDGETGPFGFDPRTLLETLSSAGNFEVVGNEDVDGFPTHHLRATTPEEALDVGRLRQGVEGTATRLEVWVDDDDLVRRLDFRIEEPWDLQGSSWSVSIQLSDLGEPVSIEAPANAPEWVPPPDATR